MREVREGEKELGRAGARWSRPQANPMGGSREAPEGPTPASDTRARALQTPVLATRGLQAAELPQQGDCWLAVL